MSDVKFYCPECGARLSVKEEATGKPILCPECAASISIPATKRSGAPRQGTVLSLDLRFLCPYCDKKLAVDAVHAGAPLTCPKCDEPIAVPQIGPNLLPAMPAASRAETATVADHPATVLSEDEVAFLLASD